MPLSDRPPRTDTLRHLRHLVARTHDAAARAGTLPFGLVPLDTHLPRGGLSLGALHEVAPATVADLPAAFGFMAALLGRMTQSDMTQSDMTQSGKAGRPVLLATGPGGVFGYGRPHGHGLSRLGLSPARLLLVDTADETQTLWVLEEALRSALPAAVAGVVPHLSFKTSQRLHLAAETAGCPLLLLRPPGFHGSSIAMTRWRVGAAPAARDRFGTIARTRWKVTLERCRNGRPGEWLVEFDHAYRFSLAAAMADPALSGARDAQSVRRHAG